MVINLVNNTNDEIKYIAFTFFLEKGYEATNIRDICKSVDIKAASLYFYYKSKQELFFSIYDGIWIERIHYIKQYEEIIQDISTYNRFHDLFIKTMEFCSNNIAKQKYLLRYHLFPPAEISDSIREKLKFWTNEENKIILNIINECLEKSILKNNKLPEVYLQKYKKFENSKVIDMIISNIKINPKLLDMLWVKFWNCNMLDG